MAIGRSGDDARRIDGVVGCSSRFEIGEVEEDCTVCWTTSDGASSAADGSVYIDI